MLDLVVRGGLVCDGSGGEPFEGDVGVRAGCIARVGRIAEAATYEIDAGGLVVAPGFIDVHTHYDCQLFWDPSASPSPWHGVTTVVTGNCGFTIAPCRPEHRQTIMRLLSFVEGMSFETLSAGLPWTWETFGEYLAALEEGGVGVNVAPFVGHSAVRLAVMGEAATERAATADERRAMAALVREAMSAGAIGWSTSLSPTHFFADDGVPAPSRLADEEELRALAKVLGHFGRGVIEVAPTSAIGGTADKLAEMERFRMLAAASRGLVTFAPLFQNDRAPGGGLDVLASAAAAQADGLAIVPQVGCRPLELRFDFRTPGFGLENNPVWRPRMALALEERRRLFADPAFRATLDGGPGGFVASLAASWDRLVLRVPASEANARWQDRSVAAVARECDVPPADAFCELVLADDLGGQWGALVMNTDEDEMAGMIRHPAGQIALSDAGAHMDTLCDQGFTTSLLGHWVRERGALTLAEAVRLVSALPADRFGLAGRGRLAEGNAADLVVFDADRVGTRPTEVVHDLPGGRSRLLQEAVGVEWVTVNGEAVVAHGVPTGARPGRVLRGGRA